MTSLTMTEFRRRCFSVLENLPEEGIVLTRHGQPVAKITPIRRPRKGRRVTLPLVRGKARSRTLGLGLETPFDLIFD